MEIFVVLIPDLHFDLDIPGRSQNDKTSLVLAPSKEVIVRLCNEAFLVRNSSEFTKDVKKSTAEALELSVQETCQLLVSLKQLVKCVLFQDSLEASDILQIFPDGFHKNLRDLLTKVLADRLPEWRAHVLNNLVSLPRLVDFDWRVDVKTSSESLSRMSVPTCLLQLKVQQPPTESSESGDQDVINVELSKQTLNTMLDGLGKIRDQLNSVAKKS